MDTTIDRRKIKRLHFRWPVWFAENFHETLLLGQMQDVSSGGMAFSCNANEGHLYQGQKITIRFCVPRFGEDDSFDMANFVRSGYICKIDGLNHGLRRVAVHFFEPLPFDPLEESIGKQNLEAAMM